MSFRHAAGVAITAALLVGVSSVWPGLATPQRASLFAPRLLLAAGAAQSAEQFQGPYEQLDPRRRRLVDDWLNRYNTVTRQSLEPHVFYDSVIKLSSKTTFEAITNALMTTKLTDASGTSLGDGLDLIEQMDGVRGQVLGAPGDRQFRLYVHLKADAMNTLERSAQFKRRADNTIFHKGYPVNYRGQGGMPSIQISIALDGRRSDIDVDYRSPTFPVSMFNGHLTAANSDVRAGGNFERHTGRWNGLDDWWRNFFGIRLPKDEEEQDKGAVDTAMPRVGDKNIEVMTADFLKAWLVDGDIRGAMGYISPHALSCMGDEGEAFDRGMAPFALASQLKRAHDVLPVHTSLEGLTVGVRLTRPGLRPVRQPHHAQFVLYAVPDDVAAVFDCESRRLSAVQTKATRTYGNYFGATFNVAAPESVTPLALLWAREGGYWKIVSWRTDPEQDDVPDVPPPASARPARIDADTTLVQAAQRFLEDWLLRKDFDGAFNYLSPRSYACYDLARDPSQPASSSPEDAGRKIRAALERAGGEVGNPRDLDAVVTSAEPFHPAFQIMRHKLSRTFTLATVPAALAEAGDCSVRASGAQPAAGTSANTAFEMTVRVRMPSGDPPVLRTMWAREGTDWRITTYDVETP